MSRRSLGELAVRGSDFEPRTSALSLLTSAGVIVGAVLALGIVSGSLT